MNSLRLTLASSMLSYRKDIRSRMQREDSIAASQWTRFVEVCTGSFASFRVPAREVLSSAPPPKADVRA
jgi:hypothetical protein